MIGSLRGTVLERFTPATVLLEVAGVGYLCTVTSATFAELEPTVSTFLHVNQHRRLLFTYINTFAKTPRLFLVSPPVLSVTRSMF